MSSLLPTLVSRFSTFSLGGMRAVHARPRISVVLVSDMKRLGRKGQVVSVKGGYARNYLIPNGFAAPAIPSNISRYGILDNTSTLAHTETATSVRHHLADQVEALNEIVFRRHVVNEKEKLYGSVNSSNISSAILKRHGINLPKEWIQLESPLKTLGEHEVQVAIRTGADEVKTRRLLINIMKE